MIVRVDVLTGFPFAATPWPFLQGTWLMFRLMLVLTSATAVAPQQCAVM
jgi:hypothetical protein